MIVLLHGPFQSDLFYVPFVRRSSVFVDFFFVLSGFVVSLSYFERVRNFRSLAGFMTRRIGRLWPLHLFVLALFLTMFGAEVLALRLGLVPGSVTGQDMPPLGFVAENAFLLHAFRNHTVFWLNFPSWSISAEIWVYMTLGVLCLIPRLSSFLAATLILLSGLAVFHVYDPGFGHFFDDGLFRGVCYFFVGHFCYRLWTHARHIQLPHVALLELFLVVLIFIQVSCAGMAVAVDLLPLTFAATILVFSLEAGPVSALLKTGPFQYLGRCSYSIYLLHAFIFVVLSKCVRGLGWFLHRDFYSADHQALNTQVIDFGSPLLMDGVTLAILLLVVALAGLTYRFVELPCQRGARNLAVRLEGQSAGRRDVIRRSSARQGPAWRVQERVPTLPRSLLSERRN